MELDIVDVNGVGVLAFREFFNSCNAIEVEVGTTGYCGGGRGHGCRTYFKLENRANTDLSCKINGSSCGDTGSVEIMLCGDSELETFVDALEFAAKVLKAEISFNKALAK